MNLWIYKDPAGVVRISTVDVQTTAPFDAFAGARTLQIVQLTDHLPLSVINSQLQQLQNNMAGTAGDEAVVRVTLGGGA